MNLWSQFQKLLPSEPLLIGDVTAHNADGTSTIQAPDGAQYRAQGQTVSVGLKAFVKAGRVVDEAPNLTSYVVEV